MAGTCRRTATDIDGKFRLFFKVKMKINNVLMAYGFFIFMRKTAPFHQIQKTSIFRHPTNSVFGKIGKTQFTGKESETIAIDGVLMPEITGGRLSLEALHKIADKGESYPLIGGNFQFYGYFVIEEISLTQSVFFPDGSPRKIEFSLKLKRVDDDFQPTISETMRSFIE